MIEKLSPQQKLIEKYKGKTFEVIDEQGWIRNNAKLSSMGYHTYCPYSVEGVDDICAELNELYEEKERWRKSWIEEMQDQQEQSKTLVKLMKENQELKEIIYEDESQIIGEWSSHILEDMEKLNKAYESDDINDLIRFCKGEDTE